MVTEARIFQREIMIFTPAQSENNFSYYEIILRYMVLSVRPFIKYKSQFSQKIFLDELAFDFKASKWPLFYKSHFLNNWQ